MKQLYLTFTICFTTLTAFTQIHGNGNLTSSSFPVEGLTSIDIQFIADIILDYSGSEIMTIKADENILEWIGKDFTNGHLTLDQIKWVNPSKRPKITIGCPGLVSVYQGTHSTTVIKNLNTSEIALDGNVGQIIAEGKTDIAIIKSEGTKMNLNDLEIVEANINISDDAIVMIDKVERIKKTLNDDAQLVDKNNPSTYLNEDYTEAPERINFKIKNNSLNRKQFYVKGPNKNGKNFSYGFPMMPQSVRDEYWTVGTKIYQMNQLGTKKLLVVVTKDFANKPSNFLYKFFMEVLQPRKQPDINTNNFL